MQFSPAHRPPNSGEDRLPTNGIEVYLIIFFYYSTPIVFAIPPGELFNGFEKLIQPFEWLVWALIFLTFFIGILVIVIISWKFDRCVSFVFGTKTGNPVVNMLIAIFAQTQPKLPRRNFSRFFLMSFLLFCLIQRNVYQGKLYIFLQSEGRHKEVQTLAEMIVEKNFSVYMQETAVEIIESFPKLHSKYVEVYFMTFQIANDATLQSQDNWPARRLNFQQAPGRRRQCCYDDNFDGRCIQEPENLQEFHFEDMQAGVDDGQLSFLLPKELFSQGSY